VLYRELDRRQEVVRQSEGFLEVTEKRFDMKGFMREDMGTDIDRIIVKTAKYTGK
jgi:hypothetical protein